MEFAKRLAALLLQAKSEWLEAMQKHALRLARMSMPQKQSMLLILHLLQLPAVPSALAELAAQAHNKVLYTAVSLVLPLQKQAANQTLLIARLAR